MKSAFHPTRLLRRLAPLLMLVPFIGYSQIADAELRLLIENLNGDDYETRHLSRMILQDHVSDASHPDTSPGERLAVEKQLIALLKTELPQETTLWILRQIDSIASQASIDILTKLLDNPNAHVSDAARMALQRNPSEQATEILLSKLQSETSNAKKIGYINALAERQANNAASSISLYLTSKDIALSGAAASAIAKLKSDAAEKTLRSYRASAQGQTKVAADVALLNATESLELLVFLIAKGSNPSIQAGAFKKYLSLNPKIGFKLLQDILAEPNNDFQNDAIRTALQADIPVLTRSILKNIDNYTTEQQATIVGTFTTPRSPKLETAVLKVVSTESQPLKIQAIEALGRVGSVKSLSTLLASMTSKSRELRETAEHAISLIDDTRIDRSLIKSINSKNEAERILAIEAIGHRAYPPANTLVAKLALDRSESDELRKAALETIETMGDVSSLNVLVDIIVTEENTRLRRVAQTTLKRITLRLADPAKAWAAFDAGFQKSTSQPEAQAALVAVIDSAPTKEAIQFLQTIWEQGDPSTQKTVLRLLSSWRNWDGGFALIEIANDSSTTDETRADCFKGIGRLILGSDATYNFDKKFDLAEAALKNAQSASERTSVITGFRYATWRERVRVQYGAELDPELKAAILEYANS